MANITIIDALCGSGKTSWIIDRMNRENKRWIYVAPYLDEVNRIIDDCPKRSFKQPRAYSENGKKVTKSEDLFRLVKAGVNIASTHELFKRLTEETTSMLRTQNYSLVLDEILEIVEQVRLKPATTKLMFDKGFLLKESIEGSNSDKIQRVIAGDDDGLESILMRGDQGLVSFNHLKRWADLDRLVWVNDSMLLWLMPSSVFDAFDEIYNLTYLFLGSYQKTYYDLHGISYDYKSVRKDGQSKIAGKQYSLIDYDPEYDVVKRGKLRSQLNVYEGKLNGIGDSYTALSLGWWKKKGFKAQREDIMRKTLYNYLARYCNSTKDKAMWSCFEMNKDKIKPNGYATSWVPFNQRATNLYRGKQDLAFLVNRFIQPMIDNYFRAFGFNVNEGMFALSELVQWLFRSGLRDGKTVNIYLPSLRMRHLLVDWLNDSLEAQVDVVPIN